MKLVETGATSVTSIEVVLKAESSDIPDEDPSKGGEQTIEVPVDKAVVAPLTLASDNGSPVEALETTPVILYTGFTVLGVSVVNSSFS